MDEPASADAQNGHSPASALPNLHDAPLASAIDPPLDLTSIASSPSIHSASPAQEFTSPRPTPHHTLSSLSTASTATIIHSDFSHITLKSSSRSHSTHRREFAPTPSSSSTAGNSPSSSPGLFSPRVSIRPRSAHDDYGTYSSPFLHHTQRAVPKETHVADVDVDPISGRKIINQYEIIDELGRGMHGKVKLGRVLPSGDYVAIKIVERYSKRRRLGKSNNHQDKIKKEIAILKKARHPNIVSLLEVIDDPAWKKVYIVLEFVELGEVAWRTLGANEICLIEYRRHLRDLHGIELDVAARAEESKILADAQAKRNEQRRPKIRRPKLDESWSFETRGDDSDDDGAQSDSLSLVSNHSSLGRKRAGLAGSSSSLSHTHLGEQLTVTPKEAPTADSGTEPSLENAKAARRASPTSDGPPRDNMATATAAGLEGSMHGSYEPDFMSRGRTPSVAASIGSRFYEDPYSTSVPDHFRYVPLMTLEDARSAFRDTVLGVEYLHYQGVIHRDIKPANLLQTRDHRIKISDFGVSYLGRRERGSFDDDVSESEVPDIDEAIELAKTVGTPAFYAPELCQLDADDDEVATMKVSSQIDVWTLGVTLYCLVYGRVPFFEEGNNKYAIMTRIREDELYIPSRRLKAVDEPYPSSRPSSRGRMFPRRSNARRGSHELEYEEVEDDLRELLRRLLIKDPLQRIKLLEVKHHPWVHRGILDPLSWMEETDPSKYSGTRIQVSKEDVAEAVVPVSMVTRTISQFRKFGEKLGLGRSSSTRARAQSSAANLHSSASGLKSAASSSSTISQHGRRAGEQIDESVGADRWRDQEHLLFRGERMRGSTGQPSSRASSIGPQTNTLHRWEGTQELCHLQPAHEPRDGPCASKCSPDVGAAAFEPEQPAYRNGAQDDQ